MLEQTYMEVSMPSSVQIRASAAKSKKSRADWLAALKPGDEIRLDMRDCPDEGSGAWIAKVIDHVRNGRGRDTSKIYFEWKDDEGSECEWRVCQKTGEDRCRKTKRFYVIAEATPSARAEVRELALLLRSHGELHAMLTDTEFMGTLSLETLRTMIAVLRPRFDKYTEAKGEAG